LWKNLVNSKWAIWSKISSRIFFWMVKKPQSVGRHEFYVLCFMSKETPWSVILFWPTDY
jgi:hypothetical protein